jgi:hypothetical protein
MQPVLAMLESLDNGHYCATGFQLMMAGDWVLMVQAEMPGGGGDGAHVRRTRRFRIGSTAEGAENAA